MSPVTTALRLNHVSVSAPDLERSARFYMEVFGLVEIPAPDFGTPVRWFRAGDLQLHLFHDDSSAPPRHHFALSLTNDGFAAVYARAKRDGFVDPGGVRRLPDGKAQAYIRDPGGNRVEINAADASELDMAVVGDLTDISGPAGAELYL